MEDRIVDITDAKQTKKKKKLKKLGQFKRPRDNIYHTNMITAYITAV